MARWLQVTLPLTALTVLVAWLAFKWAQRFIRKRETLVLPLPQDNCDANENGGTLWRRLWNSVTTSVKEPLLPTHVSTAAPAASLSGKGFLARLPGLQCMDTTIMSEKRTS